MPTNSNMTIQCIAGAKVQSSVSCLSSVMETKNAPMAHGCIPSAPRTSIISQKMIWMTCRNGIVKSAFSESKRKRMKINNNNNRTMMRYR